MGSQIDESPLAEASLERTVGRSRGGARWRIESAFNRLNDSRRIETRDDRPAQNDLAHVCLDAALAWGV